MSEHIEYLSKIRAVLLGLTVGDALGVPVEYRQREALQQSPVTDMIGYGTYYLPPGTFSDDGSLALCLAEALTVPFDINIVARHFIHWYTNNFWTARGHVFDVGIATRQAIERLQSGIAPLSAGGTDEGSNGNGSLMRIAPLVFYLVGKEPKERFTITQQVSSITHAHIRSVIACFYYLEFALQLMEGKDRFDIYENLQRSLPDQLNAFGVSAAETGVFSRLLKQNIYTLPERDIKSTGYVLHTLEATIWCLLNTGSYEAAVLRAVNLGDDSDTTAAVTGALAGLVYGYESIPSKWRMQLARHDDILDLASRMNSHLTNLRPFVRI